MSGPLKKKRIREDGLVGGGSAGRAARLRYMPESSRRTRRRGIAVLPPAAAGDSALRPVCRCQLRPHLPELGEQNLCFLQILGVEAFGEPVIHRGQQLIRLLAPTLALP